MDIRAIAASTAAAPSTTGDAKPSTQQAGAAKKGFATLFAEAKSGLKPGESLAKVDGHEYARIKGGSRDEKCINLSGNERSGQAFDLIWRDGRQFHVYGGSGADHKVVEIGHKAPTPADTGGTASGASPDATQKTS
jgi:hypothetical protein